MFDILKTNKILNRIFFKEIFMNIFVVLSRNSTPLNKQRSLVDLQPTSNIYITFFTSIFLNSRGFKMWFSFLKINYLLTNYFFFCFYHHAFKNIVKYCNSISKIFFIFTPSICINIRNFFFNLESLNNKTDITIASIFIIILHTF